MSMPASTCGVQASSAEDAVLRLTAANILKAVRTWSVDEPVEFLKLWADCWLGRSVVEPCSKTC